MSVAAIPVVSMVPQPPSAGPPISVRMFEHYLVLNAKSGEIVTSAWPGEVSKAAFNVVDVSQLRVGETYTLSSE